MSGIGAPQKPNRRLIGDYPRLPVRTIQKWGTITLEWPQGVAHALSIRVTRTAGGITIETAGELIAVVLHEMPMPVVRGRQRGIRTRMVCPSCGAVRDALHWVDGEWRCRGAGCGNLGYPSRHRERFCPAIRRRAKLLRKLARVPPRGLRARLLREQIAQQEAAMLASIRRVNQDLTKRRQRHARIDNGRRAG